MDGPALADPMNEGADGRRIGQAHACTKGRPPHLGLPTPACSVLLGPARLGHLAVLRTPYTSGRPALAVASALAGATPH